MSAPEDVDRELDKIADALDAAVKHHKLQNEANAALHCNDTVYYSPRTTRLVDAQGSLELVRKLIQPEEGTSQ